MNAILIWFSFPDFQNVRSVHGVDGGEKESETKGKYYNLAIYL